MPTPHDIAEFLRSSMFEYGVLPLVAAAILVFVKTDSKRMGKDRFSLQELAIGLDLILAAVVSFATYAASLSKEILFSQTEHSQNSGETADRLIKAIMDKQIALLYVVAATVIGLWILSASVRSFGWKNDRDLNLFGIFLPLCASAIPFVILGYFIGA